MALIEKNTNKNMEPLSQKKSNHLIEKCHQNYLNITKETNNKSLPNPNIEPRYLNLDTGRFNKIDRLMKLNPAQISSQYYFFTNNLQLYQATYISLQNKINSLPKISDSVWCQTKLKLKKGSECTPGTKLYSLDTHRWIQVQTLLHSGAKPYKNWNQIFASSYRIISSDRNLFRSTILYLT